MAIGQNKKHTSTDDNIQGRKRPCEWKECKKEGRYRIQTSARRDDIHWFCNLHVKLFDLSIMDNDAEFNGPDLNWAHNQNINSDKQNFGLNKNYRLRHISPNYAMNYTREDIINLKTLGLETGARQDDIKKAYKRLVKHCHPDHNPDLENASLIFTRITEAYMALKGKKFK